MTDAAEISINEAAEIFSIIMTALPPRQVDMFDTTRATVDKIQAPAITAPNSSLERVLLRAFAEGVRYGFYMQSGMSKRGLSLDKLVAAPVQYDDNEISKYLSDVIGQVQPDRSRELPPHKRRPMIDHAFGVGICFGAAHVLVQTAINRKMVAALEAVCDAEERSNDYFHSLFGLAYSGLTESSRRGAKSASKAQVDRVLERLESEAA